MGVSTPHHEYNEYLPVWEMCDDFADGQRAVHKAGVRYLPKLSGESDVDYSARVKRSDLFAAFWRTIAGLSGMAFRKPPEEELPASIVPFTDNIDLKGTSLAGMARELVEDVLEYGRIGVMVDHPAMPVNVTAISRADWERMNLRPTLQVYGPKSIINWRTRTIGNATVLSMVVLKEEAYIAKDEFSGACEDRYRVLDLDEAGYYRQRVFKVEDGKDILLEGPIYPAMNGKPMREIPFFIAGPNGIEIDPDEPPLIDLADANLAHYQVNSDYRHGLHFTGLPTLFLAGVQQEEGAAPFYVGGQTAITSPHPDAKGMYIEYSGQGLGAVKDALAGIERRMAVLGARMIADETGQVETLGATQIKRAGENGVLASIVNAVSTVLEKALTVMAEWAGASGEVRYQINRDFTPAGLSAQDLTALVGAWQAGAMSEAELFDMLKRGDVIEGDKTLEVHKEELDQTPALARPTLAA